MVVGLPTEVGPRIPVPGLFGELVAYLVWILGVWMAHPIAILLLVKLTRLGRSIIIHDLGWDLFGWRTELEALLDRPDEPPPYSVEALRAAFDVDTAWARTTARRWGLAVGANPVAEEMVFRGIPLLLALSVTGRATLGPLLVAGTAIWAIGHARTVPRSPVLTVVGTFLSGVVFLYFWLIGLWWVAIGLHALQNAVAMGPLTVREWVARRRRPFQPGEEHTVTIQDPARYPPTCGLFGGLTEDGRLLYVALALPGESARVRVANATPVEAFAIPIDDRAG